MGHRCWECHQSLLAVCEEACPYHLQQQDVGILAYADRQTEYLLPWALLLPVAENLFDALCGIITKALIQHYSNFALTSGA